MKAKIKQIQKLRRALENGYRTQSNGERVLLSPAVRKDFELKIRAFEAKQGKFIYLSVNPFGNLKEGYDLKGRRSYGPARRYIDGQGRKKYCSREQFQKRIKEGELFIMDQVAVAA